MAFYKKYGSGKGNMGTKFVTNSEEWVFLLTGLEWLLQWMKN